MPITSTFIQPEEMAWKKCFGFLIWFWSISWKAVPMLVQNSFYFGKWHHFLTSINQHLDSDHPFSFAIDAQILYQHISDVCQEYVRNKSFVLFLPLANGEMILSKV